MKLWLIEPRRDAWEPYWDMAEVFVIRAETARQARQIADANGGDENEKHGHPWLSAQLSRCSEIGEAPNRKTEPALIIRDFKAG